MGGEEPRPDTQASGSGGGDSNRGDKDGAQFHKKRGKGKKGQKGQGSWESKYVGKCEELQKHVYDVGMPGSHQDLFANMTKEIAEYVATHYDDAADFRCGLPNLAIPPIPVPVRPQPDANGAYDPIELDDYKHDQAEYK